MRLFRKRNREHGGILLTVALFRSPVMDAHALVMRLYLVGNSDVGTGQAQGSDQHVPCDEEEF